MIAIFIGRRTKRAALLLAMVLIIGLVAANSLFEAKLIPTLAKPGSKVIRAVRTDGKQIAITFDISWGTKVLPQVLDVLDRYQTKCTFFLGGPWVANNPELARSIVSRGHEIGSHGHRHLDYTRYSKEVVLDNLAQAHQVIREATGIDPALFRPPNGKYDSTVRSAASDLGYTIVLWSVDSYDWKTPGSDAITKRVLSRVRPGGIVLMHASDSAKDTPAALGPILEGLKQKGYECVKVSQLIQAR